MKEKTGSMILESVIGIIVTIIFYNLLNQYYHLIPFLNEDFQLILPLYNLSIMVSIFFQASRILFPFKVYRALGDLISVGFMVVIAYQLWVIFPFNTSWWENNSLLEKMIRFSIVVPTILAVIGTTITFIKALVETFSKK